MNESNRAAAQRKLMAQLARVLQIDPAAWSRREREGFKLLAPLVAQVSDLPRWSNQDKDALAELCRVRLAPLERDYIKRMRDHDRLREGLARAAQRVTTVRS